ncbi:MAG: Na+/H+ antiporter subunit E [Pseudomonadota bacterium]
MATRHWNNSRRDKLSLRASSELELKHSFEWRRAAFVALLFAGLWWFFTTSHESWLVGLPCVLLAACLASLADDTPLAVRPARLPRFLVWFVFQSIRGGIDVARRALTPSLPVTPCLVTYRSALPPQARPWLAITITLLPGTLAARLSGDLLEIHTIELSAAVEADIEQAEQRIAALIGPGILEGVR